MNARVWPLMLIFALCPALAAAQGYAGLGGDAEGFALPDRTTGFDFPRDHGPHADFRIEWWYVTANLTGPDGRDYGVQWTLFRSALAPREETGWSSPQIWMGHAALTTADQHFVAERWARGGIGQAGVEAEPFHAWIDDWEMRGPMLGEVTMSAAGGEFSYELDLKADRPFVPQGEAGYSVKSAAGQASRYYSQPFYEARGTLTLPSGTVPVTGTAWLDREWSSRPLTESQTGWDWFSLSFETGERFMGYRLRDREAPPYAVATWIAPDGTPEPYPDGAFTAEPLETREVAGRPVPVRWRVRLPDRRLDVEVEALNPDAWMTTSFPYWEGPIRVTGSHEGRGYLEMTGYE
jgi:predicted secreted hydrolase